MQFSLYDYFRTKKNTRYNLQGLWSLSQQRVDGTMFTFRIGYESLYIGMRKIQHLSDGAAGSGKVP